MKLKGKIYMIGLSVFVAIILAYVGNVYFTINPKEGLDIPGRILSLMMIAVGLITFFGIIGLGVGTSDSSLSKTKIRQAIVISTFTCYLVLLGTVSFFVKGGELPPITNTMLNHFTTVIGVVIAFYFGSVAYEVVHKSSSQTGIGTEDE